MRITEYEKEVISGEARNFFGDRTRTYLFGSRVDDSARGGDIDLLLIPDADSASINNFERKYRFRSR